jgi:cell division cycle protein 20 (cofactor of APC complex)
LPGYQLTFEMVTRVTSVVKFDVDKFNGNNDYNMWCLKLCTLLVQQSFFKALKNVDNLPKEMNDEEKEDLIRRAHSVIHLC